MTKPTKISLHRLAVPGCCFVAGVLLTLLWTSSFKPKLQAPAEAPVVSASADALNKVAEALSTSTSTLIHNSVDPSESLTRDDLLIAIPSSLGRSAACFKHDSIYATQASVAVSPHDACTLVLLLACIITMRDSSHLDRASILSWPQVVADCLSADCVARLEHMHACRLPLVEASRLWREGTRAFVVIESSTAIDAAPPKFKVSNIGVLSCLVTCHLHGCLQLKQSALGHNTYACANTQDMLYKHAGKGVLATASRTLHAVLSVCLPNRRVQYLTQTRLFCSSAANAYICTIRALGASVIRLVGCQKQLLGRPV